MSMQNWSCCLNVNLGKYLRKFSEDKRDFMTSSLLGIVRASGPMSQHAATASPTFCASSPLPTIVVPLRSPPELATVTPTFVAPAGTSFGEDAVTLPPGAGSGTVLVDPCP